MKSIDWAPNVEFDDILLAIFTLFRPWIWRKSYYKFNFEKELSSFINSNVVLFDSGRSSLYEILGVLDIGTGDEVMLQAYTCVALPNPILWREAIPVYVDLDPKNFNISIGDLSRKVTNKTKAVVVQYTFGITPNILEIKKFCRENNLILIEDCCHNFGFEFVLDKKKYMAGTIGDFAIFSFGMEKVISSTRGGAAVTSDETYFKKLKDRQSKLKPARIRDIFRGLLNPLIWKSREKLGGIGEFIYKLAVSLKVQELGLTKLELIGKKSPWLPYSMPASNSILGLNQLKKFEKLSKHRIEIAKVYLDYLSGLDESILKEFGIEYFYKDLENSSWLRFPLIVKKPEEVLNRLKKNGIFLGNWYNSVIHGKGVELESLGYKFGSCSNAEVYAKKSINLPTHIGIDKKEAEKIMDLIFSA